MLSSVRAFRASSARSFGAPRAAFSVLLRPLSSAAVGRSALRASLRARISALESLRGRGSRFLSTESTEKKEQVAETPAAPGAVEGGANPENFDVDAFLKSEEGKMFGAAQDDIKEAEKQREAEKIPKATEHRAGDTQKMTFQTETRQILDIVAKSLYHDKEVFLRELISNASDALEKLRYLRSTNAAAADNEQALEIHVVGDEENKTLTVQDFGVGMTKDELVSNLGTIARSGSKAFIKEMKEKGAALDPTSIIGQFGVGFYSSFMVSNKVEVFSRSAVDPNQQHYWSSDGSGEYEVAPAEGVPIGTKIVMHLREDCLEFTKKRVIEKIIQKYSNFVGSPIYLNGKRLNTVSAIWTRNKNEVTDEQHEEFYRFISNAYDTPTYRMHFTTDSPISIKALFYFPERHTEKYGMGRLEPGVSLYSRKVLIQPKSKQILPDWMRFVKGVVDSEDIPLNISRENMQDNALITRMNNALVRRIIKFLDDQSKQDKKKYNAFVEEFGSFLKEGVVTDSKHKGDIARLLRYDSSAGSELTSLDEYVSRMPPDQKGIYYFVTTNRVMAENSPYLEQFKKKNIEVLFMYQHIDDFVMRNLEEYGKRKLISIESTEANLEDKPASESDKEMHESLCKFFQEALPDRVSTVRVSERLISSPCMILDHESAAMRKMIKYVDMKMSSYMPKQKLEINPNHEIIRRIYNIKDKQPAVARLVVEQLFDNALIAADILDNPQQMLPRLNKLMLEVLDTSGHGASPVAAPEAAVASPSEKAAETKQ